MKNNKKVEIFIVLFAIGITTSFLVVHAINITTSNTVDGDIRANGGEVNIGSETVTEDERDENGNYNSSNTTKINGDIDVKNGSLDITNSTVGDDISVKDGSANIGDNSSATNIDGKVMVNTDEVSVIGQHDRVIENGNVPVSGVYDGRSVEREITTSRGKFYQKGAGEDGIMIIEYTDGSELTINGAIRDGIINYETTDHAWHKNGERHGLFDINGIIEYEGIDGKWSIVGEIIDGEGVGRRVYDSSDGEHFESTGEFSSEFSKGDEQWSQTGDTREYRDAEQEWSNDNF